MWFFLSLFFAMWSSVATLFVKDFTTRLRPIPLLFIFHLASLFFIFLMLLVIGFPKVTSTFFQLMFISATLDLVAFLSSFSAISISPVSLLAPLSSFGPVFTTIIAIFTLGEIPTQTKFLGILLTVFGAYLLNIKDIKKGVLKPIKNLLNNKGSLLYLLSVFLWSITPIFQKKAIFETTPSVPLFASFVGIIFVTLFVSPFVFHKIPSLKALGKKDFKLIMIFGLFTALSQLAAYTAFSLTNVGYVTAIMRTSSLFTILLGGKLLKEERITERFLGAIVMIAGALLIALKF